MQNLDIYTAYFMSGLTYIVMPIVSWVAMSKEHNRPVRLWCIGGICVGLGLLLMAMRGKVPDMLSYLLANALISAGELSRIQALRIESKRSLSFWTLLGIWIVFLLIFEYTRTILQDAKLRLIWGCLFHSYTFFRLAYWSFRLSRQAFFKVARWISVGYLILGSMFVVRAIQLSINSIESNLITNTSVGFSIPILVFFCAIIVHFGYIGMSLDRSIMQMRLQQSELEYRTLADSGPLFVRIQNNEHICEYVNATWLKFTGKSFADAIKQNWQQFIHPDDQVEFYTAYQNFWLNHQAFSIIFRIQQADTTYRWLDEYCAPRYNVNNNPKLTHLTPKITI